MGAFMETKLYKNALDNHQSLLIAPVFEIWQKKNNLAAKGKLRIVFSFTLSHTEREYIWAIWQYVGLMGVQ